MLLISAPKENIVHRLDSVTFWPGSVQLKDMPWSTPVHLMHSARIFDGLIFSGPHSIKRAGKYIGQEI